VFKGLRLAGGNFLKEVGAPPSTEKKRRGRTREGKHRGYGMSTQLRDRPGVAQITPLFNSRRHWRYLIQKKAALSERAREDVERAAQVDVAAISEDINRRWSRT